MSAVKSAKSPGSDIRYPDFAKRLERACDGNGSIPPPNFGRLGWFVDKLAEHQIDASQEGVRKWFAGLAMPRPRTVTVLSEILQVDEAWLLTGRTPDLGVREQKLRNAEVDGVVNVVAGVIQMDGGRPGFPEGAKQKKNVDLYAIIRGAQYAFHIALAVKTKDGHTRFAIPADISETVVIGVVRTSAFSFDMIEIDVEALAAQGKGRGGQIDLLTTFDGKNYFAGDLGLKRIESFAERL